MKILKWLNAQFETLIGKIRKKDTDFPRHHMERYVLKKEGRISAEQLKMEANIELVWRKYNYYYFAKFVYEGVDLPANLLYEETHCHNGGRDHFISKDSSGPWFEADLFGSHLSKNKLPNFNWESVPNKTWKSFINANLSNRFFKVSKNVWFIQMSKYRAGHGVSSHENISWMIDTYRRLVRVVKKSHMDSST